MSALCPACSFFEMEITLAGECFLVRLKHKALGMPKSTHSLVIIASRAALDTQSKHLHADEAHHSFLLCFVCHGIMLSYHLSAAFSFFYIDVWEKTPIVPNVNHVTEVLVAESGCIQRLLLRVITLFRPDDKLLVVSKSLCLVKGKG